MHYRFFWVFFFVFLTGWFFSACGDPNVCGNDTDCKDGKICLHGTCSAKPADGGEAKGEAIPEAEAQAEEKAPPEAEPQPEPEPPPEPRPEPEPPPEIQPEPPPEPTPGTRKKGDPCDPREGAHYQDRCGPGLACAEITQTTPSSGAPQPYGFCLEACGPQKKDSCPQGTRCQETLDTKTRQPTGIFVCAPEADEGEPCVNVDACKKGLTCVRYGTTGTFWLCHKECTNDPSACAQGSRCEPVTAGSAAKICKKEAAVGEPCNASVVCDNKGLCLPSGLSSYPDTCMKKCDSDPKACDSKTEACRQFKDQSGRVVGSACVKLAQNGEECNRGYVCADSKAVCLRLTYTYAVCLKKCTGTPLVCSPGESCARYSSRSTTELCLPSARVGEQSLNLARCEKGSRGISFSSSAPGACLPTCSAGTQPSQALCGILSPGDLRGVLWLDANNLVTVGQQGTIAISSDGNKTWERRSPPVNRHYYAIAASSDGKLLLAVGEKGLIAQSTDRGKTWSEIELTPSVTSDLKGIALSADGKLALAVGAQGTVLRSEDGAKTWSAISNVTGELNAVTLGRDTGTGSSDPIALAVGNGGLLWQSTDGGKSWTKITVAKVSEPLLGVVLLHDRTATGTSAFAVGAKGTLLKSDDDGKTWTTETSPSKENLYGVAFDGTKGLAVGAAGTVLRLESGKWSAVPFTAKKNLYATHLNGSNVVATGTLGSVYFSTDGGKTWTAYSKSLFRCLGVRSSSGASSGGACAYLCDPNKKGADCPLQLGNCNALTLSGQKINICMPGSFDGTAKKGDSCSNYQGAVPSRVCRKNHDCTFLGDDFKCLRTCTPDGSISCDSGDKCIFNAVLSKHFCGTEVAEGQPCDLAQSKFCGAGLYCKKAPDGTQSCVKLNTAKEFEHCASGTRRPCEAGMICIGMSATPYRRFCSRICDPNTKQGCPAGWDCLATNSGGGVCLEVCPNKNHTCQVSNLFCQKISTSGKRHCI